jgi:hypothetical protein
MTNKKSQKQKVEAKKKKVSAEKVAMILFLAEVEKKSASEISQKVFVDEKKVEEVLADNRGQLGVPLADKLERLLSKIYYMTADRDIRRAKLSDKIKSISELIDRVQLLRDKPTSIGRQVIQTSDEVDEMLREAGDNKL